MKVWMHGVWVTKTQFFTDEWFSLIRQAFNTVIVSHRVIDKALPLAEKYGLNICIPFWPPVYGWVDWSKTTLTNFIIRYGGYRSVIDFMVGSEMSRWFSPEETLEVVKRTYADSKQVTEKSISLDFIATSYVLSRLNHRKLNGGFTSYIRNLCAFRDAIQFSVGGEFPLHASLSSYLHKNTKTVPQARTGGSYGERFPYYVSECYKYGTEGMSLWRWRSMFEHRPGDPKYEPSGPFLTETFKQLVKIYNDLKPTMYSKGFVERL